MTVVFSLLHLIIFLAALGFAVIWSSNKRAKQYAHNLEAYRKIVPKVIVTNRVPTENDRMPHLSVWIHRESEGDKNIYLCYIGANHKTEWVKFVKDEEKK